MTLAASAGALVVIGLGATAMSVAQADPVNTVTSIDVGGLGGGVAIAPNGSYAYVSVYGPDISEEVPGLKWISVIDTNPTSGTFNTVIGSPIETGGAPAGIVFTPDGTRAYVANYNLNEVQVINTENRTLITTITVGSAPSTIGFNSTGTRAYTSNSYGTTLSVINTDPTAGEAYNTLIDTITVGSDPYTVAVAPNGQRAYSANIGSNTVSVIDTTATPPVGIATVEAPGAFGVAVTPDGSRFYYTNINAGTVSVFGTANNSLIAGGITVGTSPNRIAFTPNGNRALIGNAGSASVSVIDTNPASGTYNTVIDTIAVPGSPRNPAITPDGTRAYVTNWNGLLGLSVIQIPAEPTPTPTPPAPAPAARPSLPSVPAVRSPRVLNPRRPPRACRWTGAFKPRVSPTRLPVPS